MATKKEVPKEEKVAAKEEKPAAEKKAAPKKERKVAEKKAEKTETENQKPETAKKAEHPAPAPAAAPKKKPRKKKSSAVIAKGKRKEAIARAVITPGKGRFVFNQVLFDTIPNKYIREIVKEPLNFLGSELHSMDINVYVRGGGQMGQAQAARVAVAKALVEYTGNEALKNTYLEHDRALLVDDVRRVEPKKYKGPKARARFQKSYR